MEPNNISNLASYALLAQDASQQQPHSPSLPRQSQSPAQHPSSQSNSSKRKSDDGVVSSQQQQQRAKRNRYISIACNECKRRKIKCNGQTPCQRCGNLNLECVYAPNCCNGFKDTQEYKDLAAQVAGLQEQVAVLFDGIDGLRAMVSPGGGGEGGQQQQRGQDGIDPALQQQEGYGQFEGPQGGGVLSPELTRPKSRSQQVQQLSFRGPTSSDFNFSVAKSSLQTMGITGQPQETGEDEGGVEGVNIPSSSASPTRHATEVSQQSGRAKDPIWTVPKDEGLRLCKVFEDEMGAMYPIVSANRLLTYAMKLYGFMDAVTRNGFVQLGMPGADAIDDEDTNILKMVLAIAMTVEGSGHSDRGRKLFQYVQPDIDATLLGSVGVKGVRLLALTVRGLRFCKLRSVQLTYF